jgi:hypothetical protein
MLKVASDDTPAGHGDGHSVLLAGQVIRWKSWHRWTTICLLAYIYLAVAVAVQCQQEADSDTGLILVTVPELLRLLRDVVIPPPRRDRAYGLHWSEWRRRHQCRAAKPTGTGTPMPKQRHDHNELQLLYQRRGG